MLWSMRRRRGVIIESRRADNGCATGLDWMLRTAATRRSCFTRRELARRQLRLVYWMQLRRLSRCPRPAVNYWCGKVRACDGHVTQPATRRWIVVRDIYIVTHKITQLSTLTVTLLSEINKRQSFSALRYDTIRYNTIYLCALISWRNGQLSLAHGTETKNKEKL